MEIRTGARCGGGGMVPAAQGAPPALYCVRVLEIPTPRWSTLVAIRAHLALPQTAPVTIQERAWSSPIWYARRKRSSPPADRADPCDKIARQAQPRLILLRHAGCQNWGVMTKFRLLDDGLDEM